VSRLLCFIGLHNWHPTAAIFETNRISKLMCTRCGVRKWWRA
jgi:hypothetical protein